MCLTSTSMWILLLGFTSGLIASSWASSTQEVKIRGCSFAGVFHIQGNDRYTLSFDEAEILCQTLGATLASATQMATAYNKSMESCRNGWIRDGNITILRHTSNNVCAGGQIGIVIFKPTEPKHDAYCYDEQDLSDRNCNFTIGLDTSLDNGPAPSNAAEIPSDTPTTEDTSSTTKLPLAFSEVTTVSEEKSPFPTSSEDKSGVVVFGDQSTGPLSPTMVTSVSAIQDDSSVTVSPSETVPEEKIESTEVNNTSILSLDNTSSGMGEPAQTTTEEPNSKITQSTTRYRDKGRKAGTQTEPTTTMSEKRGEDSSSEKKTNNGHNDWLVILCALLAVAVILLVCAAVVTRKRWCGKRKTLMITSKSNSEGNGTAASAASAQAQERQQEMVMLMNKEKIQENGNTEEFTVITLEESPEKNEQA